jgi:OmpA-OmpF porin, OOP family
MNKIFIIGLFACSLTFPANAQESANATAGQLPSLKAYDNYDFVPGEKILFEDNFSDDQKGEFPKRWHLACG